jgi:hypothetical protein
VPEHLGAIGQLLHSALTNPTGRPRWSITVIVPARPGVTNGTAATLDEAKAKFRETWTKAKARGLAP